MAPFGTLLRVDSDETGAYPASWETDVVLSDGQTVHVRPIVPDDAERLVRFHSRQSPESIYFRYFSPASAFIVTNPGLFLRSVAGSSAYGGVTAARVDATGSRRPS